MSKKNKLSIKSLVRDIDNYFKHPIFKEKLEHIDIVLILLMIIIYFPILLVFLLFGIALELKYEINLSNWLLMIVTAVLTFANFKLLYETFFKRATPKYCVPFKLFLQIEKISDKNIIIAIVMPVICINNGARPYIINNFYINLHERGKKKRYSFKMSKMSDHFEPKDLPFTTEIVRDPRGADKIEAHLKKYYDPINFIVKPRDYTSKSIYFSSTFVIKENEIAKIFKKDKYDVLLYTYNIEKYNPKKPSLKVTFEINNHDLTKIYSKGFSIITIPFYTIN